MIIVVLSYLGIGIFSSLLLAITKMPGVSIIPKTRRDFSGLGLCIIFWPWLLLSFMLED